jgi:ABC-type branched-subunit amino acid transport system substrate-binding protein
VAHRHAPLVALAALLTVGAGACGSHVGGRVGPTTPSGSYGPPLTLSLGFIGHLRGLGASTALAVEQGERLAVSQYAGGAPGVDVVLDQATSDGTAAGAASAARRLVADRVVAIIGPQTATELQGAGPVLAAAGIPTLSVSTADSAPDAVPPTSGAPTTVAPGTVAPATVAPATVAPATVSPATVAPRTSPATPRPTGSRPPAAATGGRGVVSAASTPTSTTTAPGPSGPVPSAGTVPWLFRLAADNAQQGTAAAGELTSELGATTLAVVSGPAGPDRVRARAVVAAARLGGATVAVRATISGRSHLASMAMRIVGSGASGVYASGPTGTVGALIGALDAAGYQGVIVVAAGDGSPQAVRRGLGPDADGVYVLSPADDTAAAAAGGGSALVFDDAYRAAFGQVPPIWSVEAYDATRFVLAAVSGGAATAAAVGAYLLGHTWSGVGTQLAFTSEGALVSPPVFVSRVERAAVVQTGLAGVGG